MKYLLLLIIAAGQIAFASEPPANYPVVKGIIRKVDQATKRVSIKHETIPNLDMPGMTMSFALADQVSVAGLKAEDKINFVADEVGGELTVLWIAKAVSSKLPLVKGIVRKIDMVNGLVSIKHETIPNLEMPGMTMTFLVEDPASLSGLAIGDKVLFSAAEINGELAVITIEKDKPTELGLSQVFCTGIAETSPRTKVQIEIRTNKFSTIRYEQIEGPYRGTTQVNSIGHLALYKEGEQVEYRESAGEGNTKLSFKVLDQEIINSKFTHYSSSMKNSNVACSFE